MRLSKRYTPKTFHLYALTSWRSNEGTETLYDDKERVLYQEITKYTFLAGYFNAKVGKMKKWGKLMHKATSLTAIVEFSKIMMTISVGTRTK